MIEKKLEDARKDLLDLTYRNRLINYRPAPKRSVLVVDEEPRELFDILVIQGKRMQFSPRPKKTDGGDSESQSDQVSEEDILANDSPMIWTLPDQDAKTPNNHTDLYLQTNLESEFLQKRLFYIAQESKSVFEEQGYTILYLATGFLEWTETPKGVVHKAPLILIPVEIERDKIRTSFKLAWTGEDLITNISLQAKLSEINVNLPSFEMPEKKDGIDLYFKTVTDSIKGHENWQVTREIHLDFFTYSKFVMYRDLDPVAWPGENSPALHPLITAIFGDEPLSGLRSSQPFPEQEIDARLPTRSVYHVRDADSSQIAVIEDLKAGMNLVVEGPPGTGKSQTIVNVIAEFLAIGKTVLFVSEKMAALEVVKGRLDSLGLGIFCLELHNSKKANKKKVLGEIQRAIGLRCPVHKDNDEVLQNVEDLRNVLNGYTTALSTPVGRLGFTPYDLYGMLESARRHFVANGYHMANVTLPPPDSITPDIWSSAITTLKEFDTLLPLVSPVKENPWRFCTPGSFFGNDVEEIMRLLSSALENLSLIRTSIEQLVDCAGILSPTTQTELVNAVPPATEILIASEPIDRSVLLNESWNRPNNEAEGLIQKIERYQAIQASITSSMEKSVFTADLDSFILEFEKSSEIILHSFIEPNNTTRAQNQIPNGTLPPLDSNTLARWSSAIRTLEELEVLLPSVSPVKENPWRFCTPGSFFANDVEEIRRHLSSALENLSLIRPHTEQLVACAGIVSPTTQTELVNAVHATEMLTASEPIDRSVLLNESWNRPNNEAEGLIQRVEMYQAIQASITSSMQESVFTADLDLLIDEFEMSSEKILHSFIEPNNKSRAQNQMPNGTLPPLDSNTLARWSPAIRTLEELDALLPLVSPVKENPWQFCTPGFFSVHDAEEVNRLLSSALENLSLIQTSIDHLVECAGIASPTTQMELVNTVHAIEILTASEPIDRSVLLNESWDRPNNEAEGLIQKIEAYLAFRTSLASSMRESVFAADLNSLILEFETSSKKILHSFIEPYKKIWVTDQRSDVTVPSSDTITLATWSSAIRKLEELDTLLPFVSPVKENPWRFCTPGSFFANDVTEIRRLLSSALEDLSLIRTNTKQLTECAGIAIPTTQTELVNAVHATEMMTASEPIDRSVLLDESWDRANNEAEGLIQKIEIYQAIRTSLASSMQKSVFLVNLDSLIPEFETSSKKILRSFRSPYNRIRDQIDGYYLTQEQRSDEALLKDLREVQRFHALKQEIHDVSRFGQLTFGAHWREEESSPEDLRARSGWIVKFRHELLTNVLTPRSVEIVSRGAVSDHARDVSATIKETRARFNSRMATLLGRLVADTTKYFPCGLEATPFDDMQIVLQAWLTGIDRLVSWTQYLMVRKEVEEIGLESVKAADLDSFILDLHSLFVPYKKIRAQIDDYYITRGPRSDEALLTGLHEVQRCNALKQEIYDASSLGHLMFGAHWREEQSSPEHLHAISGWIVKFRHALLTNVLTPRSAEIVSRGVDSDRVREITSMIEDARVGFNSNIADLSGRLAADTSKYFPSNPESTHFTDIQAILQAWLTGIDRLVPWTRYLTLRKEIAEVNSGYFENGRWMIQYPTVRKEVEEPGQASDYAADLDILILDLHSLFVPYKKIKAQIDGYYLTRESRSDEALLTSLHEVQRCHALKQEIQEASSLGHLMFGVHWSGEKSNPEYLHAFSRWIVTFRHALLTNVLTPRSVEIVSHGVDSNRVCEITSMIEDARAGFNSHVTELLGRLAVDSLKYFPSSLESTHFTDIEAVLQAWLTGIDRLMPWTQYMTVRKEVEETMKAFRAALASTMQKSNYAADLDSLILDLHSLLGPYKKNRAQIDGYYLLREQRSDVALLAGLREVQHCQVLKQEIQEASSLGHLMFGVHWSGEKSNPEYLHAFSRWIVTFRHALLTNVLTPRSVGIVRDGVDSDRIREITTTIEEARARFNALVPELLGRLAADKTKYFPCGHEATRFDDIATILESWLLNIGRLVPWTQYLRVRKEVEETIAAPLMPLVELGQLQGGELQACLKGNYAMSLLRLTFAQNSALDRFVGHVHEQRIKDFVDCDRQMIRENQLRIAQRLCKNRPVLVGGASPSSEIGFLQTELNRKRGHASIRQLLTRAMKPIQQIKPCFMMSPPSIAQFLDPSLIKFDIVIFDEASQVKPAEALGAILRGKQVAVIGDSKQLPPTSFFDKIVAASESEDGDDAMPSDMESVLNLCKTRFPSRTLLWHYRSRHDSLIGLSNKEFYNNELYVFPSPMRDGEELGLKFVYLPETVYDRGKSGMNRGEARAVAEAVIEHAHRYPNRSLGVGTFNIHQQEAILEELERLRGENPDLEEFFADKGTETFFVKNLETIQGDERDVIFLSLGFGYDIQHKLSMNFGALNKDGGERRLNVLITRARRRCVVFANFRARELPIADIQTASRGVQVLKLFLEYAETGKVPCTMESPANSDSPFEEAVYAFLTEYGYVVHKRVGCIGYQIDLAVVNPDILGEYLIGIECDGATYYSSRVARDRDRLRLEILKGLGWRIHRVWSTDWFRDPGACQNALIAAIDQALETAHERIVLPEPVPKSERSAKEGMFQAEVESVPETLATTLPLDKEMPLVPAYVICDTLQIRKGIELKDYLPGEMATLIAQVVNIEGPVHYDEVVRRIRDTFDVKRTGNQIKAAIDAGGERAAVLGTVMINGEFLWPRKRPASIVRRRGEMIKPRIEMICDEELEEAALFVLKWQYATEREALATGVCHVVGIRKVSGDAKKRVQQVIAGMMSRGTIEEKLNGLIDITASQEKSQSAPSSLAPLPVSSKNQDLKDTFLRNLLEKKAGSDIFAEEVRICPEEREAESWYNKGNAHIDLGNYDAAIACYDQTVALDSINTEANENHGFALATLSSSKKNQFNNIFSILAETNEESKPGSRIINKEDLALPDSIRQEFIHPEKSRWDQVIAEFKSEDDSIIVPVNSLASLIPIVKREWLTPTQSKLLFLNAHDVGYVLIPDYRISGTPYRWDDSVALFPLPDKRTCTSDTYPVVAFILELGMSIALADEKFSPEEQEQLDRVIFGSFELTSLDVACLKQYQQILILNPPSLERLGTRLKEHLSDDKKLIIARYLRDLAFADGKLDPSEYNALNKIFKAMGLGKNDILALFPSDLTSQPDEQPIQIFHSSSVRTGEPIIKPISNKSFFILDPDLLREKFIDTREIQKILTDVIKPEDEELLDYTEEHGAESEIKKPFESESPKIQEESSEIYFFRLHPKYSIFLKGVLTQTKLSKTEMQKCSRNNGFMLDAAVEDINTWSEENYGDILFESTEENLISINSEIKTKILEVPINKK